jgi:hypothetical protein
MLRTSLAAALLFVSGVPLAAQETESPPLLPVTQRHFFRQSSPEIPSVPYATEMVCQVVVAVRNQPGFGPSDFEAMVAVYASGGLAVVPSNSPLPTNVGFVLKSGAVSFNFARNTGFSLSASLTLSHRAESLGQLEAAVPPGVWNLEAATTPSATHIATRTLRHEAPPDPLRLENFAALQAWNGGSLTVNWSPVRPFSQDPMTLEIRRADGTVVYSSIPATQFPALPAVTTLTLGSRTVTIPAFAAAPGEVFTAQFRYVAQVSFDAQGALNANRHEIFFEFPIRRLGAAPALTAQPAGRTVVPGSPFTLTAAATGAELSYQWRRNGQPLAGATSATYAVAAAQAGDSGDYTVVVANAFGSVTSDVARISVAAALAAPALAAPVAGVRVLQGAAATLTVAATGDGVSYQWKRDGVAIPGATQSSYWIPAARYAERGNYTVVVSNAAGAVESTPAALAVDPVPRLANLSVRTRIGGPEAPLTVGITAGGDAAARKTVLIRGAGPTLAAFGVTGAAPAVEIIVSRGAQSIASNRGWGGLPAIAAAGTAVGAFPFADAASLDAALVLPIAPGGYTTRIAAADPGGVALAEIYDATPDAEFLVSSPRLINLSALAVVGTGGDLLIAGFNLAGSGNQRLLVRAVGPTLGLFGVGDPLVDPRLELRAAGASTATAENDNWDAGPRSAEIAAAAASVGAFALAAGSKDAVLLVDLPPGSYTAQVSGVAGGTGTALIEIYAVAAP